MIGWQYAVAIEKEQVRRAAGTHSIIATAGKLEAIVRMGREHGGETGRGGEIVDDLERRFVGPVIGDDDFGWRFQTLLQRDRSETFPQVFRLVVRRHQQTDLGAFAVWRVDSPPTAVAVREPGNGMRVHGVRHALRMVFHDGPAGAKAESCSRSGRRREGASTLRMLR